EDGRVSRGVPAHPRAQARAGERHDLGLFLPDAAHVLRAPRDRWLPGRQGDDPRHSQRHGAALRGAGADRALLGIPAGLLRRTELRKMLRRLPIGAGGAAHAAPPRRAGGSSVTETERAAGLRQFGTRALIGWCVGLAPAVAATAYLGISN